MAHRHPLPFALLMAFAISFPACAQQAGSPDEIIFGRGPAPTQPSQDSEDIDLGDGSDSALAPPPPPSCDASLPSGGIVGLWAKNMGSTQGCPTRLLAKGQLPIAMAAHSTLWCSDPGGLKASARARLQESQQSHAAQARTREAKLAASALPVASPGQGFMSLLVPPVSKRARAEQARLSPMASPPDFASDPSALWDAREAQACKGGPQALAPELGPALSAYAMGKISTPSGSCDALLVEATLLTGRHPARASWIAAPRCPGFSPPDPQALALAVASGAEAAQAWQSAHLAHWRWLGKEPRPAYSRQPSRPTVLGASPLGVSPPPTRP